MEPVTDPLHGIDSLGIDDEALDPESKVSRYARKSNAFIRQVFQ